MQRIFNKAPMTGMSGAYRQRCRAAYNALVVTIAEKSRLAARGTKASS
jgi:hypothetical protein